MELENFAVELEKLAVEFENLAVEFENPGFECENFAFDLANLEFGSENREFGFENREFGCVADEFDGTGGEFDGFADKILAQRLLMTLNTTCHPEERSDEGPPARGRGASCIRKRRGVLRFAQDDTGEAARSADTQVISITIGAPRR